jgi:Zn-dependent peptidase ImmA (M78 family)/DNA-binding XRE family transcriptional regulator
MPSSPTSSAVGRRLREARERLGLTQAQVALRIGKTPTAISYWEGGQRSPDLDDILALGDILNIGPNELLRRPPQVIARAEAAALNMDDVSEAVDRALALPDLLLPPPDVPDAPSSNPAEAAGFARRRAGEATAPIQVTHVLEQCGCRYEEDDLPDELQGFVVVVDEHPVVVVKRSDPLQRRRFTAAHELGHVLLRHYDTFHLDLSANEGAPPNYNWRHERAANDFAASLLMPEELVRTAVETTVKPDVRALAASFEVSRQAMSIRLAALGIQLS